MSEMKTLKFPGDAEPREIVDAKARDDISKLSDEIANIPSGVGMDITGATVGQIAKIAAVDASGVPTAWSPVDMPSGGSVPKPLTYDYMPEGYPTKSVLFDIEWDGDTSGLVSVADIYYKVANYTAVTKADLAGCMLSLQNDPEHPEPFPIEGEDIYDTQIPHTIMVSDYVLFVSEPTSFGQFNFTEPGIYMPKNGERYVARLVKQTITTIAGEFLPYTAKNTTVFHSDFGPLKHDDGTLVTAQEAYDAFMNTRVLIMRSISIYQAVSMLWYDNNSAQTDPTNVGYVQLACVQDSSGTIFLVNEYAGDSSIIPG